MVQDKNSNIQTQHGNGRWWTKFITNRNIQKCSNRENILHFDFSFHLATNGKINNQGNIYLPKGAICAKTIVLPPISWIANNRKLFPFLLSSIRNISQWHYHNFGKMVILYLTKSLLWCDFYISTQISPTFQTFIVIKFRRKTQRIYLRRLLVEIILLVQDFWDQRKESQLFYCKKTPSFFFWMYLS